MRSRVGMASITAVGSAVLAALSSALLLACGSSGSSATPTDVTIGGALPGRVNSAIASQGSAYCAWPRSTGTFSVLSIRVSSFAGTCGLAQSGNRKAGETFVEVRIGILAHRLAATPITPGTYAVGSTSVEATGDAQRVDASVVRVSESCYPDASPLLSGTVTIASISDSGVTGTVDLAHSVGDTPVTGTFSAAWCTLASGDVCSGLYPAPSGVCGP